MIDSPAQEVKGRIYTFGSVSTFGFLSNCCAMETESSGIIVCSLKIGQQNQRGKSEYCKANLTPGIQNLHSQVF